MLLHTFRAEQFFYLTYTVLSYMFPVNEMCYNINIKVRRKRTGTKTTKEALNLISAFMLSIFVPLLLL